MRSQVLQNVDKGGASFAGRMGSWTGGLASVLGGENGWRSVVSPAHEAGAASPVLPLCPARGVRKSCEMITQSEIMP